MTATREYQAEGQANDELADPVMRDYRDWPQMNYKAANGPIADLAEMAAAVIRARIRQKPQFALDQEGARWLAGEVSNRLGRDLEHAIRVAITAEMDAAKAVAVAAVARAFPPTVVEAGE